MTAWSGTWPACPASPRPQAAATAHGDAGCRPVYLIECAGEHLNALPEIHDGREITRALLAQLPPGTDLLSPQVIQMYYQRYYSGPRRRLDMQYPVSPGGCAATTMVDLLCSNPGASRPSWSRAAGRSAPKTSARPSARRRPPLRPSPTRPSRCLCPTARGRDKLLRLQSAGGTPALLRELQPYTVSLSRSQCQRLGSALYPVLDGAALVLQEPYYDSDHKGLTFTPNGMTILIT